jgi:hypothetical protein
MVAVECQEMLRRQPQNDYQPVSRSGSPRLSETGHSLVNAWPVKPEGDSGTGADGEAELDF